MINLRPSDKWGLDAPDGAYEGVPERAYHAHPALSRSVLATLIEKSPRHAQHKWNESYEEGSPGIGTIAHDRVLRPEVFEQAYARAPGTCEGTTSSGDPCGNSPQFRVDGSWRCRYHGDEEDADNITRLSPSDAETVEEVAGAVSLSERLPFADFETEVTLRWEDPTGLICRARPDILAETADGALWLGDLKTTGSAHPEDAARQLARTGSWLQPAFYERGLRFVTGGVEVVGFTFFFVETTPPYVVQPLQLEEVQRRRAQKKCEQALQTVAKCIDSFGKDPWPAYDGTEVQLPHWKVERFGLPPAGDRESPPSQVGPVTARAYA